MFKAFQLSVLFITRFKSKRILGSKSETILGVDNNFELNQLIGLIPAPIDTDRMRRLLNLALLCLSHASGREVGGCVSRLR